MDDAAGSAEWVKGLTTHRAGRLLSNHLACVELQARGEATDCATTEALANERVFIHSLARSLSHNSTLPCGLPMPLPKYIAILNLSGERMLAYSNSAALMRALCTQHSRLRDNNLDQVMDTFAQFPAERTTISARFVLLVYSLPWQAGAGAAFWHLSACEVSVDETGRGTTLRDRMLQFSSVAPASFNGKSLRDPSDKHILVRGPECEALPVVAAKQLDDFAESYSAVSLDTNAPNADAKPGGQQATLQELVEVLKRQRVEAHSELKAQKALYRRLQTTLNTTVRGSEESRKDAATERTRAIDEAVKAKEEMLDLSQKQNTALAAEIEAMRESLRKLASEKQKEVREHGRLTARHTEVQRQSDAKDALYNTALSQHVATISRLEGQLEKSREEVGAIRSELQKEHAAATSKAQQEHAAVAERLKGALESKKRIINQLSENNDRKDVEKDSLQTHADEQSVRIRDLVAECKRLEAELKKRHEAPPPPAKARSKSVGTKNASTATHHRASTQTLPRPATPPAAAPAPTPTVGRQVVGEVAPVPPAVMPCSLQAAINMLQHHVTFTTQGPAQPLHPVPIADGYSRPLPFPHFNPAMLTDQHRNGPFHPVQQPQPQRYAPPKAWHHAPHSY